MALYNSVEVLIATVPCVVVLAQHQQCDETLAARVAELCHPLVGMSWASPTSRCRRKCGGKKRASTGSSALTLGRSAKRGRCSSAWASPQYTNFGFFPLNIYLRKLVKLINEWLIV